MKASGLLPNMERSDEEQVEGNQLIIQRWTHQGTKTYLRILQPLRKLGSIRVHSSGRCGERQLQKS